MYSVVDVVLDGSNKIYYFNSENFELKKGQHLIVELESGLGYGVVEVATKKEKKENLVFPLKSVIRLATKDDIKNYDSTRKEGKKVVKKAQELAKKLDLDMKVIDAYFTFDKTQLFIKYTADDRVDFRELAKKLAQIYKTRIELRQIGVRDKTKQVGGLGPCGRMLCCKEFLNDFNSVSINMAKNQFLSLNPTKINGACGRLLCCLNYEDDLYTELKEGMPAIGEIYKDGNKMGEVIEVNIFKKYFLIQTKENTVERIDL